MQLFSIGLHLLNDDGTPEVDSHGTPLPSYTNRHVTEYARVWTGFDYQKRRGNLEEDDFEKNLIDPMQIRISWRDHLPKVRQIPARSSSLNPRVSHLSLSFRWA